MQHWKITLIKLKLPDLALLCQRVDNFIHWINCSQMDNSWQRQVRFLLKRLIVLSTQSNWGLTILWKLMARASGIIIWRHKYIYHSERRPKHFFIVCRERHKNGGKKETRSLCFAYRLGKWHDSRCIRTKETREYLVVWEDRRDLLDINLLMQSRSLITTIKKFNVS